ncbi:unnamed protein product [Brachionus calyciflorus]|uniref:Uncharacterized protein n=1 Tax=Brachionus calyciflorus TaxID=104777 RepID=A0A814D3X1_9BILA|nr:unnamed protein product [Brachionus calyciflorus]
MCSEKRNVLLLIDNAAGHEDIIELTADEPIVSIEKEINDPETIDRDLEELKVININEALSYANQLEIFFAQSNHSKYSDLEFFKELKTKIQSKKEKSTVQSSIKNFLIN